MARKSPKRQTKAKGAHQKPPTAVPPYRLTARLQLRWLAHARSGDKGDTANVGLIALEPEYYDVLQREVTVPRVT
jgi:hypothetical protein